MRPFRFRTEANAKGQRPAAPFSDFGRFQWADQVDANDYSMDQVGIQHDSNSGIIQRERDVAGRGQTAAAAAAAAAAEGEGVGSG